MISWSWTFLPVVWHLDTSNLQISLHSVLLSTAPDSNVFAFLKHLRILPKHALNNSGWSLELGSPDLHRWGSGKIQLRAHFLTSCNLKSSSTCWPNHCLHTPKPSCQANPALWPAALPWAGADVIGPNGSTVTQKIKSGEKKPRG